MRKQKAEHPGPIRSLARVFGAGLGRKIRSDAKGKISGHGRPRSVQAVTGLSLSSLTTLRKKQKKSSWRTHQSVAHTKQGKCAFKGCPHRAYAKAKGLKHIRGHDTRMRCEECSAEKQRNVFYCNDTKKGTVVNCHLRHHDEMCKRCED